MATLEADAKGEITLTLIRGDSDDFLITVTDDATPANPIDLSKAVDGTAARRALVRFAVKSDPDTQTNAEALVFKSSHWEDQIPFLTQSGLTLGQCRVLLDKPDTEGGDTSTAWRWDVEVTRQDVIRTAASVGTVALTSGNFTVAGTGTNFLKAKVGDVLQPVGGLNTRPALIEAVVDATHVLTDYDGWHTETGVTFELRRGKSKTAARGPFVLKSGVVAL